MTGATDLRATQRTHALKTEALDQPLPQRVENRLGTVRDAQLQEDVRGVISHGALPDLKRLGDFAVADTARHEF